MSETDVIAHMCANTSSAWSLYVNTINTGSLYTNTTGAGSLYANTTFTFTCLHHSQKNAIKDRFFK